MRATYRSMANGRSIAYLSSCTRVHACICMQVGSVIGTAGTCHTRTHACMQVGSVIGTAGTCYTALFIFKRLLDKSYAAGGKFFTEIPAAVRPAFAAPTAARPLLNSGMFV